MQKLQAAIGRRKIDAIIITEPGNRRYLSGYSAADHGIQESAGVLFVPAQGAPYLLTDSRFMLQAEEETTGFKVELYPKGMLSLVIKLAKGMGLKRIAFESHYFLHSVAEKFAEAADKNGLELVPVTGFVERMRVVKSADELTLIAKSVALNERVFQLVYSTIEPGMSEIEIALALELTMKELGAERPSFETIVAFGTNSARPHAVPTDRVLQSGDIVLVDMGLVLQGYCSDMTRTFIAGKPGKTFLERLRVVRKAQLAAIDAIRAGVICRDVDRVARKIIDNAGYGRFFGHGLGHGVGLVVHEDPSLGPKSRKKLRAGMVVTVEPGIYLPEWGGIRLENMVVVGEHGCDVLNKDTTGLDL